jgi:hypothetical protein
VKSIVTIHATDTSSALHLTGKDVDRRDRSNGFSKCGYHFVISREGEVYEGRKLTEASIHDDDDAALAISVCLVGGSESDMPEDNFTLSQWEALKAVIRAVGETNSLTSVRSKTDAVTSERVNRIIHKPQE